MTVRIMVKYARYKYCPKNIQLRKKMPRMAAINDNNIYEQYNYYTF